MPDGFDCEAISERMFKWLDKHIRTAHDKEHVTTLIREKYPEGYKYVHIVASIDLSHIKLSVDTPEEYQRSLSYHAGLAQKKRNIQSILDRRENHERYTLI